MKNRERDNFDNEFLSSELFFEGEIKKHKIKESIESSAGLKLPG